MYLIATLAIVIGGLLILSSEYLLYAKRISLDNVAANPALKGDAIKIEIEKIINVTSNVPALGLFLIGLVIVVAALYYANAESTRNVKDLTTKYVKATDDLNLTQAALAMQKQSLSVSGTIAKEDHAYPGDIEVVQGWPIFTPDQNGRLNGLTVWRDPNGRLPTLTFSQPNYSAVTINLDKEGDAKVTDKEVVIQSGSVVLKKLVGKGGEK